MRGGHKGSTDTPIAKSVSFFNATIIAVICSAAFPTIGSLIRPMNTSERRVSATIASIVLAGKKAEIETWAEHVRRSVSEAGRLMLVEAKEESCK